MTAVDDEIFDGTQICWVQAGPSTSAGAGFEGLEPVTVTVTVYDDDVPRLVASPTSLTISEPDGSGAFPGEGGFCCKGDRYAYSESISFVAQK